MARSSSPCCPGDRWAERRSAAQAAMTWRDTAPPAMARPPVRLRQGEARAWTAPRLNRVLKHAAFGAGRRRRTSRGAAHRQSPVSRRSVRSDAASWTIVNCGAVALTKRCHWLSPRSACRSAGERPTRRHTPTTPGPIETCPPAIDRLGIAVGGPSAAFSNGDSSRENRELSERNRDSV